MSQLQKQTAVLVEQELLAFLDSKSDELRGLDEAGAALLAEVRRLIDAGGSRIRPVLCVTAYEGCGGSRTPSIMRVAASFELLHTFALIHDDLADGGRLRRGVPSTLAEHSAMTALLAGDMAFSLSDELYLESGADPAGLIRAFRHVAAARLQALTGQHLEQTSIPSADPELSNKIARLKTSSYSLVAPLSVGADLAGASEGTIKSLKDYGETLGVAYQMRDDLQLLSGAADKDVDSDLLNGRPTALISAALRLAGAVQLERLNQIWGDPESTATEIKTFVGIAKEVGAEASIQENVDSLVSRAKEALHYCPPGEMSENSIQVLNTLADRVSG
ncbi:MAG TPA: polyprenyl synthetase family protein [Actinomycetota bacterium]|nr:polyprenyl synthetase family protein [Actinomycetota bacterium]